MSGSDDGVSRREVLTAVAAGTATAAGASGSATADAPAGQVAQQSGTTAGNATTGGGNQTTAASGGGGGKTVTVSVSTPDNAYVFKPGTNQPLYIQPGTTVKFVWKGNQQHNIKPTSIPEGATWKGHTQLETAPFTYTHTFQTKGTYEYICVPHESLGMVGTIVVNSSGQAPGGGEFESILPESATTLGVAATGGMVSVLGLAYFFLKYGGDYGELEQ